MFPWLYHIFMLIWYTPCAPEAYFLVGQREYWVGPKVHFGSQSNFLTNPIFIICHPDQWCLTSMVPPLEHMRMWENIFICHTDWELPLAFSDWGHRNIKHFAVSTSGSWNKEFPPTVGPLVPLFRNSNFSCYICEGRRHFFLYYYCLVEV